MVRNNCLIVSSVALSSVALAAPVVTLPSPADPSIAAAIAATRKDDAHEALRRGRELGNKGDWAGAVATLRMAVALDATSAAAQSELGWAALQTRDLPLAEQASRAALARAGDDRTRAGAGYNLGRVLEARGDSKGAVDAYRASLTARRNSVVLARLTKLDPGMAAQLGPVQFSDLSALRAGTPACDKSPPVPNPMEFDTFDCEVVPLPAVHLNPPWLEAQVQLRQEEASGTSQREQTLVLLLRTTKGWFRAEVEAASAASIRESLEFKVLSIATGEVTGRPPLLIVRTRNDYSAAWRDKSEHRLTEHLHLFAMSASGIPVGSTAIPEYEQEEDKGRNGRISALLLPSGFIDIGPVKGKLSEEQTAFVGHHRLMFP